ncbi:hypothetical protein SUGI_0207920 [Cryptomeria japonica]|nr:hypothetical protein SUGI_0207920 [Cryptomeria japonica]
MAHIFRFHSPSTEASLRTILGEELLQNASSSVYYSDVVSCFLSNCMDLVQDLEFVEKFANTYIQDYFTPSIGYNLAINSYDTRNHNGLLGGIFSPNTIALCDAASCVYNAIKVAVNNNCELVFTHALKEHAEHLGTDLTRNLSNVFKALMFLYTHLPLHPPITTAFPTLASQVSS